MKNLLTFLLTALLAFSVGWAADATFTVSTYNTGELEGAPSGVSASVSTSATQMGNGGSQLTAGNYYTLTLSGFTSSYKVTGIKLQYCTNASKGAGSFTAELGNEQLGSYNIQKVSSGGTSPRYAVLNITETPFDGSDLVLRVDATVNSVYVISFTVTYAENGGTQPAEPNWYRKVTDLSDLVAGKKYIFITGTTGMGAINNNGYGASVTGLTIENNRVNIGGTDISEFTLGGASDAWTFKGSDEKYLGTSSTSSTVFSTSTNSSSDGYKWKVNSNGWIQNNLNNNYIRLYSNSFCFTTSGTVSTIYVQDFEDCATPTFNPGEGTYTEAQNVSISCATSGATIYYTTDGTTPSATNGTEYTAAITVNETTTIKAIAVASGYDNSAVAEATYTINSGTTPTGTIYQKITSTNDLTDGDYLIVYEDGNFVLDGSLSNLDASDNRFAVTISDNRIETDQNVYFTYDATARTLKSASGYYIGRTASSNGFNFDTETAYQNAISFSSGNAVIAGCNDNGSTTTAKLQYWKSGSNGKFRYYTTGQQAIQLYKRVTPTTPKVATPTFSPEPGTYTSVQEVTISCETPGATIHYTYNGGPEQTGTSPITLNVNSNAEIVAWATLDDYEDSDPVTATYTINLTPTLTASPNPLNINDDNTSGGRTGDFTVTGANLPSNVGVDVMSGNFSRTVSGDQGWGFVSYNGAVNGTVTVTYNGNALSETGSIRLASGNVTTNVNVNYLYTGPIYLFGNIGVDADHINNFDFSNGVAMTRNTTEGTYSVNITAVGQDGGSYSWMYFSKNQGQESDAEATKFGPISNESYWPLQGAVDYTGVACALDPNLVGSSAKTIRLNPGEYTVQVNPNDNTFTISALVHAPVISLAPGTYSGTQEVTITCATPGAAIYYTTDGSEPSANNGTLYDGNAISISESVTLKAVAVSNGVTSSVASAEYLITPPFVAKDYEMLTNINDLVAGQTYLIVYKTGEDETEAHVMGKINNTSSTHYAMQEQTSESSAGIITSSSDMAPVSLSGSTGNWTLLTGEGILAYPDDNKNSLTAGSTSHTWSITQVKDENEELTNLFEIKSNSFDRYLLYNTGSPRFACYTGTSNQIKYVYIYKVSSTPAILANPTTVSIELAAGEAQGSNTFTVGGRNLSEGVTLTLSAEDQAKGFSLSTNSISQEAALAGNVEVTVTYNGSGANETASITLSSDGAVDVTVTVNATREPLTVTISPASCNFVGQTMGEQVTITANVPSATIEYSLDNGTTWQTYTDGITITIGQVNNSVTVMARATLTAGGNTYTSATVSETYTRQPKGETLYEKVTDESQIKAGEKYVIVYEGATPAAFNGIYTGNNVSWGSGVNVAWRTQNQIVDIANTDAIVFTFGGSKDNWTLQATQGYLESTGTTGSGISFYNTTTSGYQWKTPGDANGYYLTWDNYTLRYNPQIPNGGPFRLYSNNNNTGVPAYLYVQRPAVMAPVITPATGEYSEHQDVTITAENGTTVYYTTDGSDPTSNSTPYEGTFAVHYNANGPTTIKAIAVDDEGNVSTIAEAVYTWIAPKVTIRPATRDVYNPTLTVVIGCNPVDATVYYTTNGSEPSTSNGTLYEGPFEVTFASLGDQVTVKAIAYNDDDVPSAVDVATYTYAEKVINVDAPFFSPLEGKANGYSGIYYGDQTLEIATTTANADIYYEIEEVSGENPPSNVSDPTKSSTHYSEPYQMTVGNSYRVKAIAYIGDHASAISEGYYIIKSTSDWTNHTDATTILENVAQLRNTTTGSKVTFRNPIQVVYMSTMANDLTPGSYTHPAPEYVYVRDNSGYGVIYFGKGATMWATQTSGRTNSPATIFDMGDWIDGSWICGTTGTWSSGLIPQVGTGEHTITSWPNAKLGNTKILAEEATCSDVRGATADNNLCGHYLHLRNTTLNDVENYSTSDIRHSGTISDASGACTYYDRFWLYSGSVEDHITFTYNNVNYTMSGLGHYDQAWFDNKGTNATFDVFCVGDYYSGITNPYEVYPLDFLWIFKPVITPPTNLNCASQQVVDITVESPDWGDGPITPTIYYKTDDMEDWEEFIGPFVVNSDTHVQAYAMVHTEKFNDIVRSDVVSTEYKFANIKEPIINDDVDDNVIEVTTGNEEVNVTIQTNPESPEALTLYTLNGEVPTLENGIPVVNGSISLDSITETTTVTAISYLPDGEGNPVLWSNPVTVTYTFVKSNGVVYDLVDAVTMDKVYVIVNKDAYMGLSTAQNGNNRGSTGVKFTNDTKEHVYGNDELALFVLESANAGRYYFKNINGGGYLTVTTNDVANLNTEAVTSNPSAYTEAAVSFGTEAAGYPATIMFSYDGTNRYLRYFAKGRTFTTNADVTLNKDVFLYGTMTTPLAIIESEIPAAADQQVTVADNLIGAWAINSGTHKYLWAKDMELSIDKTSPVAGQKDYVKNILHYQNHDWDQSNWVILDFSKVVNDNSEISPEDFVGKKLTGGSVIGNYVDDVNYRIVLRQAPDTIVGDKDSNLYPGYDISDVQAETPQNYNLGYNTYMTGNFLNANLNAPYGEGFVAGEDALGTHPGDKLFFMNPKVQEVARVWGVYMGTKDGKDVFTCLEPSLEHMANGWAITGAFAVEWDYNRLNPETYGRPNGLDQVVDEGCIFHAAIVAKNQGRSLRAGQLGEADDASDMSERFIVYPLDFKSGDGNVTAVHELKSVKDIVSIRYYNIMGMESEKPFEGINIVVTRYTDGSTSTAKILR